MSDLPWKQPDDNDETNHVYFYVVKCAVPSEQKSGDYSPNKPRVVYDRTFPSVYYAKLRQKEILERDGFQSFWTVGKPCYGAFN